MAHKLVSLDPKTAMNYNCAICQVSWLDDPTEAAVKTPCAHEFHHSCLNAWFTEGVGNHNSCPLCRSEFFELPPTEDSNSDYISDSEDDDEEPRYNLRARSQRPYTRAEIEAATEVLLPDQERLMGYVKRYWELESQIRQETPGSDVEWGALVIAAYGQYKGRTRGRKRAAVNIAEHYPLMVLAKGFLEIAERERLNTEHLKEIVRVCESWEFLESDPMVP